MKLALAALLALTVSAAEVRVRVVDASDGGPLAGAAVALGQAGAPRAARTDAGGSAVIGDLAAGDYRVSASKSDYEARLPRSVIMTIDTAEERKLVTVQLRPSPVVAGAVLDPRGDPLPGAGVRLLERRLSLGVEQLAPVAFGTTDDLGEFRLFDLRPGRYLLSVIPPQRGAGAGGLTFAYAPLYHPNASQVAQAAPIELDWGDRLEGLRLEVDPAAETTIIGVVRHSDGAPCTTCPVSWSRAGGPGEEATALAVSPRGGFVIRGLEPGAWRLTSSLAIGDERYHARQDVAVREGRMTEVALTLLPPAAVSGRLEFENPPIDADLTQPIRVRLIEADGPTGRRTFDTIFAVEGFEPEGAQPALVAPGEYVIAPYLGSYEGYPAQILLDGARLAEARITVRSGQRMAGLVLRVAFDGAAITGSIDADEDELADLAPGAIVGLMPLSDEASWRGDLIANYQMGQPFRIENVPPGIYVLAALPQDRRSDWGDPLRREAIRGLGRRVRLNPNETLTVDAPLIKP